MKKINFFSVIMALFVISLCCGTASYAQDYGDNLVINGDFSDGNSGFVTDYMYVDPEVTGTQSLQPEGRYTIGVNPRSYHNAFVNMPDNDNPFMIVNGHTTTTMNQQGVTNDPAIVWQQVVAGVDAGKDYEFSFDLRSLVSSNPAHIEITIYINGESMQSTFIGEGQTQNWVNYVWTNTDKSTSATITIAETSKVQSGNDFGLDNIMFREILPVCDMDVVITSTPVTCNGDQDGTIVVAMNGAKPFNICISYGCEPGDEEFVPLKTQTATYTGLIPGNYLITVVDANGCVYTECVTVGEPDPITAEIAYDDILCNGESTAVTVTGFGGNPPYTLFNEEGEAVATFDVDFTLDVFAGEYNWTLSDAHGCEAFVIGFEVVEPPVLEATYEATEILCNGDVSTVTVFATGGIAPYKLFDGEVEAGNLVEGQISLDVPAGIYNWTVVDANGCEFDIEVVVEEPEVLEANYEATEILCNGDLSTVTVFANGGTAPYKLFDGEAEAGDLVDGEFSLDVPAGTYNWTVVDANGCEFDIEVVVEEPEVLEASFEATEIFCNGDLSTVTVFANGGTAPYKLFDGEVEAGDLVDGEISLDVPAGAYNWTVVDANGCSVDLEEIIITEPPLLVAELVSVEDASCFGAEDGVAVISVTGGAPDYTFSMEGVFADGFFTISGLAADTYTLTISDSKNCGPEEVTFTIEEPAELVIENVEVTVPDCAPDNFPGCETPWAVSVIEEMTIEGFSTYGNGQVHANRRVLANALGMPDYSNSPPITYVSLGFGGQIVLEAGCEIVNGEGDDFEVVETSYGQSNCANYPEKADVWVAQTLDGPWSYLGQTCLSGSFDLSNGVDDTGAPFVLDWARYVRIKDVSDPADFSNGDGFDVNGIYIFNTPEAPEVAELEITITPEVEGAVYTVLNAAGEVVDINNISENGTYTIFFEFNGCFSNEFEFEVVFPEPIEANAVVTDVSCFEGTDGSAEISIIGGTAPYTIIFDGEEIEGNIIAGLAAGSYDAVIVDAKGCVEMITFVVEEPTQLVVEQTNGEILCFEGTTFVSLDIQGGTAPYVLTDDNSDFELAVDEAGLLELGGIFASGQYNWTVTDANGCYVAVEFFLEQPELLVAEESYEAITCFDGTTDVTVTAQGGVGPYELYDGETLVAEFADFTVVNELGAGDYNWTVVDANGCATPVAFEIDQPEEFTADYVLDPQEILCHNGETTAIVTGNGGTEPYFLTLGEGNVIEFLGSTEVTVYPNIAYSWTVTDFFGCVDVEIAFELANPDPIVVVSVETEDIPCHGEDNGFINIVAEGGTGALTYALNGGEAQDNGLFENLTAGDYEITITDANGCFYVAFVNLSEPDVLHVELTLTNVTEEGSNDGTITGIITGGVGPYNVCLFTYCEINEDEANEDFNKSQGFMHFGLQPGTYLVVVTDQNGCVWEMCVEIEIGEETTDFDLISDKDETPLSDGNFMATETKVSVYPNPFTTQATIEFTLTENSDVTLEIYNLVGERVAVIYNGHVNAFESHKHTFNAESLPNGIYIYRLTAGENVYHDRVILTR